MTLRAGCDACHRQAQQINDSRVTQSATMTRKLQQIEATRRNGHRHQSNAKPRAIKNINATHINARRGTATQSTATHNERS